MSSYFSNLPNVYVSVEGSDERLSYRLVKNIFRRVILEEKLDRYSTQFESYYVPDGMRPDMLANLYYGDPELDWVILIANNIIDTYDYWPKDSATLREYILQQYGDAEAVHHWETTEITYGGAVFIKEGIEVNESFRVVLPNGNTLTKDASIYPVSNTEHETYLNEKKRLIALPTARLVDFFTQEFKRLVEYAPHNELDSKNIKRTPVSNAARYIDRSSYRVTTSIASSLGLEISSYDFGPGSTTKTI